MLLNKEKDSRVKFNPGLSANRPSNNWAQIYKWYYYLMIMIIIVAGISYYY